MTGFQPGAWRGSPLAMPRDLKPARRPLVIVCGAPASGKTTWARAHAQSVIDLDDIKARLSGWPGKEAPIRWLAPALEVRNARLRQCSGAGPATAFIVAAPERDERAAWAAMLKPDRLVVLDPGEPTCRARLLADETRLAVRRRQLNALRRWYVIFSPAECEEVIGDGSRARPDRRLYNTSAWRKRRAAHLAREPLCRYCAKAGRVNDGSRTMFGDPQTNARRRSPVVDHIEPHHGDVKAFHHGALQTLCADHHDIVKQGEEHRGYARTIGADGWPVDPRHPANA